MPKPHPANVPGDFYVEDSCCLACGVWETEAPGLLAWLEDGEYPHCYVARQPASDAEFQQMMRAMEVQDLNCLRVRDCKPEWAQELCRNRLGAQIDNEQTRIDAEAAIRPRGFLVSLLRYGRDERGIPKRRGDLPAGQ